MKACSGLASARPSNLRAARKMKAAQAAAELPFRRDGGRSLVIQI